MSEPVAGPALVPSPERGDPAAVADARLRRAARDFEAIFVNQLLRTMRATVPRGGLFPASAGRGLYEGLMDEELARAVSRGRGIGLADLLVRELATGSREKPSSPARPRPINSGEGLDRPRGGHR